MDLEVSFEPQQFWSLRTLYHIMLGSAFVATVINVTWFLISSLVGYIVRRAHWRVRTHTFVLGEAVTRKEYDNLSRDILDFWCLIVRYGTDEYISKMASDQERFEGRQQLKLRRIPVQFDKNNKPKFVLQLPIHKRMGTQFKCFVVARDVEKVPAIIATLNKCEHVSDIKQSDSYHRDRVYFLLDQFFVIGTITPGVRNNFVFPE
jgi:hypothetical protein